ncbi:serine hydrolase domain-containing protein [Clostridium fungisolvens]|uniref:D-aminopeptidase n=1 Tax=Clostridium fungisolvens TaxID=1604897 RepID=A0A6V8SHX1_9CLOT|nr:serine hydrolase domain-containing protein [Clostridium fungisolvens]GFP76570.1 D-aminopeptidase [Clostridium fungisolvens]
MKKRLLAFSLVMLFSASTTTTVFAEDIITGGTPAAKLPFTSIKTDFPTTDLPFTTIDGYKAPKPNISSQLNKKNALVKSSSDSAYAATKAVADEKASVITSYYGCTSLQYALIDNGKIVLSGNSGLASVEKNTAPTADTMYGIGSVSKMFATTAVMSLVDKGRINLDAPVTQYIRDFKMADERYKKITVRMLLNHSSGLMGSSLSNALLFGDNDASSHDNFLAQLRTQRLKANPGEYSVYCNDGFTLAEILVEHVTGTSFTNYITRTILNPLKMEDTKTPVSSFDREKLAKTYANGISNALPAENFLAIGAGGIYSSAEDLCNFASIFTNNSNGILSKKSLKAMENKEYLRGVWPKDSDNVLGYGLGWDDVNTYPFNQYNIKALSKGGDTLYYHTNFTVLPDQNMAVAVISSGSSSTYNQVMAQDILLAALKEKGVINEIKPDKTFPVSEKATVPAEIKKLEGMYLLSSGFLDTKVDTENGTLSLSYPQMPQYGTQTFNYTKDGYFVSSDGTEKLKLVKETNGETYLEEGVYANLPLLGQTAIDYYIAQKETLNTLPENITKGWNKRDGKNYYLLNEKYSSMLYLRGYPVAQVGFSKGFEGYLGVNKIVDKNTASSVLDGPGTMSRDLVDFNFFKLGKYEYLSADGRLYVEGSAIDTLSSNNAFTCKIDKDGFAKWYKIGSESADKKITVNLPCNSAFVVYDSDGALVNDSLVTGSNKVKLPKDGTIVFLGNAHSEFKVQYN